MDTLLSMLGRLHVLAVHFPIGVLLLAAVVELGRWGKKAERSTLLPVIWGVGAFGAAISAALGLVLASTATYEAGPLAFHRNWGIATAGLSMAAWLIYHHPVGIWLRLSTILLLAVAGHGGGTLTHGPDYLIPASEENPTSRPAKTNAVAVESGYAGLVEPILKSKCMKCHRSSKMKGNLNMDHPESLMRGGKHGPVVIAGKPDSSTLLLRMQLPIHLDEHMPPKGNAQITATEIATIRNWIQDGASFKKEVVMVNQTAAAKNPIWEKKPTPIGAEALQQLRALHVKVDHIAEHSPFVRITVAADRNFTEAKFRAIARLKKNIVALDFSGSSLSLAMLQELGTFNNLVRLNLARTGVTDAVLGKMDQLAGLEYLNLCETNITDEGLMALTQLPLLNHLYVLNSRVTAAGVEAFRRIRPIAILGIGEVGTQGDTLQLRAPKLLYARTFFNDTVQVRIESPMKSIGVYYTLDSNTPTPESTPYRGPVVLDKTTTFRAIAAKPGWISSSVAEMSFIKKLKKARTAVLQSPPSPQYTASGQQALIDGRISDAQGDDTWLGYQGKHLTATLDFGSLNRFESVYVHCFENNLAWIFKPRAIRVLVSTDGNIFRDAGAVSWEPNRKMGESRAHLLKVPLRKNAEARFVRVVVESWLRNPDWHASKGAPCWIFIDEIIAE
jgi:hypothetical protein